MNRRNLTILSIAAVAVGAALVAMPAFAQSSNDDKAKATASAPKADSAETRKEQADRQAKKLEEIRKANAERRKKAGGEAEEG